MKNTQKGLIVPLVIIIVVLVIGGGAHFYSQNNTQIEITKNSNISTTANNVGNDNQTSETKNFRLYRKHENYVYLAGPQNELVYYKSNETEKFKNYKELDYLQITASTYTKLSTPEKEYVGIKDYQVEITQQINNITDIKIITENEFDSGR